MPQQSAPLGATPRVLLALAFLAPLAPLWGCGDAVTDRPAGAAPITTSSTVPTELGTAPVLAQPTALTPSSAAHDPAAASMHVEGSTMIDDESVSLRDPARRDLDDVELGRLAPAPPAIDRPIRVAPVREPSRIDELAAEETYLESLAVERAAEAEAREDERRAEAREHPLTY